MSYLSKITDIYDHISQGEAMDAFEKYYAKDVVMVLEDGSNVEGKAANRERENDFFESVDEFHGMDVKAITSNEEKAATSVECVMDVTFTDGNRMSLEQVAVQHWEGDKIAKERFYATQQG
ncbi:SnoaL-like domain-containing protein [Fodinibius sediminis]|uniref:SnoaL-like domain-containing protein n=1 Tax=Fodinibius sediminis TaxID=1214077 RepID=A0A521BEW6_9BACT|nr:SnoaL-like domain-containing protein [Fodinibius sediminis]SMO45648.1 SnoaL-like domain-containing protein [Fodinibius sediminis]